MLAKVLSRPPSGTFGNWLNWCHLAIAVWHSVIMLWSHTNWAMSSFMLDTKVLGTEVSFFAVLMVRWMLVSYLGVVFPASLCCFALPCGQIMSVFIWAGVLDIHIYKLFCMCFRTLPVTWCRSHGCSSHMCISHNQWFESALTSCVVELCLCLQSHTTKSDCY